MWRAVSKRTSQEIHASDASRHDGPFVCINPSCRRPVTLHRTRPNPHFQHSRGKANPACEHYGSRSDRISSFRISSASSPSGAGVEVPILAFFGDAPAHFSLSLRLPQPRPEEVWEGSIVIHEHGERIVSYDRLNHPVSDLRPRAEYSISFRGAVSEDYRRLLRADPPGLRQNFNLFVYGLGATRLLQPGEALQAAKDYWVLSKDPVPRIGDPSWIVHSTAWHGWYVTLISLPAFDGLPNDERACVEEIFGRPLRPDRLRAVIVSPLPHHFSDAGIPVYPDTVRELQIELNESQNVELWCSGQRRGAIRFGGRAGSCTAELDQCGRWALEVNGQRLLEWIKSEVDFFEPPGISLNAGGEEIPFLSKRAQSWLDTQPAGGTFVIRCPSAEVAECLSVDHAKLVPASLEVELLVAGREHSIEAGNFGRLTYGRRINAVRAQYELDDIRPKAEWLRNIALHAAFCGPHRLHGSPAPEAPGWIAELKRMGWADSLLAQVRAIEGQLIRAGVWRA